MPPVISSSEDEGGPSLQDQAAKIEALERTKVEKQKHAEVGTSMVATPPGGARAAVCKWERQALYARLAQLQESEDEEATQVLSNEISSAMGAGSTVRAPPAPATRVPSQGYIQTRLPTNAVFPSCISNPNPVIAIQQNGTHVDAVRDVDK
ncbi:UNVERIFIED_CONTAM: hypothetical protein K2H54_046939 [Gekko kuhli]